MRDTLIKTTNALLGLVMLCLAQTSIAQTYAYLSLINQTGHTLTLSGISWSGSYNPQFPTTILPGQTVAARLKRVSYTGRLSFNAKNTTTNQTCYFTVSFSDSNYSIQAARTGSAPLASCYAAGSVFAMGLGDWVPQGPADSDEDGVADEDDNCPLVANPDQENLDGDAYGDACDSDMDGDSFDNENDNCPAIANEDQSDLDADGIGDRCDSELVYVPVKLTNQTNDTITLSDLQWSGSFNPAFSSAALAPGESITGTLRRLTYAAQMSFNVRNETNGQTCYFSLTYNDDTYTAQAARTSRQLANCLANGKLNADIDDFRNSGISHFTMGYGDPNDDADNDTILDGVDNCPLTANTDQLDQDTDGLGDVCDEDIDGDGFDNQSDNCPLASNPSQTDWDDDQIGDSCDDSDLDGWFDDQDNCPAAVNPNQADLDTDGLGDVCDDDLDGDNWPNNNDNCPVIANDNQSDIDNDGLGDACDSDIDGDGFDNVLDCDPLDSAINPDAIEILNNGVDENCSGLADDNIEGSVATIIDLINSLPDSDFANGKANGPNKKKQYIQFLEAVINSFNHGDFRQAVNKIDQLLAKTDGCDNQGFVDSNDWVNSCDSGQPLFTQLQTLKASIELTQLLP